MNARAMILLVAGREISTRLRSKVYLLTTAGLVAVIVVGGFLINLAGDSDPTEIGFTPQTQGLSASVERLTGETDGEKDVQVSEVADRKAGEKKVEDGDLDVLVAGEPTALEVIVKTDLDQSLESVLTAIAQQQALNEEITGLGGDPDAVAADVAAAAPDVTALDPDDQEPARILAGYLVGILIFMGLMTTGQLVAQGIVEEKSSRVVELLLAAVRPWQLMAGKVLGIGVVGLVQVAAVVAASVGSSSAFGLIDPGDLDLGGTALWSLVWFIVGYATFALALAGLAALVSRQEEVGSVTSPVMTLMIIPYIIAVSIGPFEPDNPLVVALSYVPFCSPMVMPVRYAGGGVGAPELLLSLGISLALVPVLVWIAGRMYSNAVLQTGSRVKVLSALRG